MKVWLVQVQQLSSDTGIVYVFCEKHIAGCDPVGAPDGYASEVYPHGEVKSGTRPIGMFPGADIVTCYKCFKEQLAKDRAMR